MMNGSRTLIFAAATLAAALAVGFQNCSKVNFQESAASKLGTLGVCNGISCTLDPLTAKPAVITILVALGDEANQQLVVNGGSAQLIAETAVRYASPKSNPKVLLVRDFGAGNEDPEDTVYAKDVLLSRYDVTLLEETANGLTDADLNGYDLVWFNNPGAPMGLASTRDTLMRFKGGVIIQGDDLSYGQSFENSQLTGLTSVDNGTQVTCNGNNYHIDNNNANQYRLALDPAKIPGANSSTIEFVYGNDIDNTVPARSDLEILATAVGGPAECTEARPAIVRYLKDAITI